LELSWSTFLLEIVNFLVLVWILKHFLYKPVRDIIAQRQSGIEKQLAAAQQQQDEAARLQTQYEHRLAEWEQERRQARDTLSQEIDAQRTAQLAALQTELSQAQEKAQVSAAHRAAELERELELRALQQGAQFAARLLAETASPQLEARLLERLLKDLAALSSDRVNALRTTWGNHPEYISVTSAYPLADAQRQRLEETLQQLTGQALPVHYREDTGLLAGIRISIGAWALHANVRDELQGLAEFAHVSW